MLRALSQSFLTVLLAVVCLPAAGQESTVWIFEGLITEADPALAPDLQSGWVLAGSFNYTPLEMTEQPVESEPGAGRLAGGVTDAELTVDLYYQVHFSAEQVDGLAGCDYRDNDPDKDGRDLLGWFFPVRGQLKDSEWNSTWLQVWLADSSGNMIRRVPPAIPPFGLEWDHGWFRLTLRNAEGQTVYVDGRMEYFGPEGDGDEDLAGQWKDVADHLGKILAERDDTISRMQGELDEYRSWIDGLRRMVDLLVQERSHLQEENSLLQEQAKAADPEVEAAMNELNVQKSLLEGEIDDLSGKNRALAESLADSESERRQLRLQLQELEAIREAEIRARSTPPERKVPVYIEGGRAGTATLIEQPVVREKSEPPPVPTVRSTTRATAQPKAPKAAPPEPGPVVRIQEPQPESADKPDSTDSPRRHRPRKFR